MSRALRRKEIRLHGHPVSYYEAGSGPVLLLVHGITSSADAWRSVMPALARHFTVVAPDLLGHGGSAKPRGDYSLGAYASGLREPAGRARARARDRRRPLDGRRHRDGDGLPVPRARASGSGWSRAAASARRSASSCGRRRCRAGHRAAGDHPPRPARRGARRGAGAQPPRPAHARRRARHRPRPRLPARDPPPAARSSTPRARSSTPRASAVSAHDRLYLAAGMPTLLLWGDRDPMDPPRARDRRPRGDPPEPPRGGFPGAGHYPFEEDPQRFVKVLRDFIGDDRAVGSYDEDEMPAPPARGSGRVNAELIPGLPRRLARLGVLVRARRRDRADPLRAPSGVARASAIVYGAGLCALFAARGLYHRWRWNPRWRPLLRRIDHSTIYIFIAASYTPVALLVLVGEIQIVVLASIWGRRAGRRRHERSPGSPRRACSCAAQLRGARLGRDRLAGRRWADRLGVAPIVLFAAGGVIYSGRRRGLRPAAARTRGRACSASTRSSTRS